MDYKNERESLGLTLAQVSELTGFSIATINGLELNGKGSRRLKDALASTFINLRDGGVKGKEDYWRDRALRAEQKLKMASSALGGVLKNLNEP